MKSQIAGVTMKTSKTFIAVASAALLSACASHPTPIPVISPQSNLSALVGDWSGEYSSTETGRSGSISFKLQAGKDTAFGSVIMVPRAQDGVPASGVAPVDRPMVKGMAAQSAGELITIRFVRMEGNHVVGTLDPDRDPDCGCQLTTTFQGEFTNANTIDGTFHTVGSGISHIPASGRWKVERVAP
jgi:hypothetical protein